MVFPNSVSVDCTVRKLILLATPTEKYSILTSANELLYLRCVAQTEKVTAHYCTLLPTEIKIFVGRLASLLKSDQN